MFGKYDHNGLNWIFEGRSLATHRGKAYEMKCLYIHILSILAGKGG